MNIKINKETEKQIISSIKQFFSKELEDDIGDLKAMRVMDYFIKEIAPSVYNQAISDARGYIEDKAAELDNIHFVNEFDYWKKK